ncbi:MAG: hypothetical protein O6940_05910 [Ignavibacteria bacterium]|nr:hypothetical protein [Ignavibacteria bacterium]
MALFSKTIQEETKKLTVKVIWLLLAFLGGILYTDLLLPVSQIAIPTIPKSVLIVGIIFLLLCLIIVISYLFSYKKKFKNPYKDYLIGSKGGLIKNKESGLLFCPICFAKGKLSPLYDTAGFLCHTCERRLPRVKDEIYLPYPFFKTVNNSNSE